MAQLYINLIVGGLKAKHRKRKPPNPLTTLCLSECDRFLTLAIVSLFPAKHVFDSHQMHVHALHFLQIIAVAGASKATRLAYAAQLNKQIQTQQALKDNRR
jgi:hypothetical protein